MIKVYENTIKKKEDIIKYMNKWGNTQNSEKIKQIVRQLSENNPVMVNIYKSKIILMIFLINIYEKDLIQSYENQIQGFKEILNTEEQVIHYDKKIKEFEKVLFLLNNLNLFY